MKTKLIGICMLAIGLTSVANADTWNFTYSGSGFGTFSADQFTQHNNPAMATGSITGEFVNPTTVAITSGYIDVTQGAATGHFTLTGNYTLTGYNRNFFLYNNLFYPSSNPEIDYLGLLFQDDTRLLNLGYGTFWYGRPTDYGWFIATVNKNGNQLVGSDVLGTMSFSKDPGSNPVPEPSEWAGMSLLFTGLVTSLYVRRRKQ